MKKAYAILGIIGFVLLVVAVADNKEAFGADEFFSKGSYTYEIVSRPDESGVGTVELVGFDNVSAEFAPDGVVIFNGEKYLLKSIALKKRSGLTESYGFSSINSVVIPKEVEKIRNKIWEFSAEGMKTEHKLKLLINCNPEAFLDLDKLVFGEQLYSTIIKVPSEFLIEYQKMFNHKAVLLLHEPGDDYEREQAGFLVSGINEPDKASHFVYENNLYGIISETEHTVKLEALDFVSYYPNYEVIKIPDKAYFNGEEFTVSAIAHGGAVPAERPLYIPETVSVIESGAIDGQCPAVYFPDSIKKLPKKLFSGENRWIQYVGLPNSLTSIPAGIFSDCKKLRYINIPESVKKIGTKAFGKNTKCLYMEGDIPDNFEKAASLTHNIIIFTKEQYIDDYKKLFTEKSDVNIENCKYSHITELALNYKEIEIGKRKKYNLKELICPAHSDYRIIWCHTNTVSAIDLTLKGHFSYNLDSYYNSYQLAVYAIDVLTGKMYVCPLVQNE